MYELLNFLLEYINIDAINTRNNCTAVYTAVYSWADNLEIIRLLINNGAKLTIDGSNSIHIPYDNLLLCASRHGRLSVVKMLTDMKVIDVNISDDCDNTPLHLALIHGNIAISALLISNKARVSMVNKNGKTALHLASYKGSLEIVKLLIDRKVNVNLQANNGETAIYRASSNGHVNVVKLLIENGAKLNIKIKHEYHGNTALHVASFYGHIKIVKLLIDNGACINAQDTEGITALHFASYRGQKNIASLLIENGATINIKSKLGWTALHYASTWRQIDIVKLLVENGANVSLTGKCQYYTERKTALQMADISGCDDIVNYLAEVHAQACATRPPITKKTRK